MRASSAFEASTLRTSAGVLTRCQQPPWALQLEPNIYLDGDGVRHQCATRTEAVARLAEDIERTPRQVWELRRRYRHAGPDGLVDLRKVRRTTPHGRTSSKIIGVIETELGRIRDESTKTVSLVVKRVRAEAKRQKLACPSPRTLRRRIHELALPYDFAPAKTRNRPRGRADGGPAQIEFHPGALVQVDHTGFDIEVIHPDGKIRRLEMVIALDVATRLIPGWALAPPKAPRSTEIVRLLRVALTNRALDPLWRNQILESHASSALAEQTTAQARIDAEAQRRRPPIRTVSVDRGGAVSGDHTTDACALLGIEHRLGPPARPTVRAGVEATFNSINHLFTQYLAGHLGRDVNHRSERRDTSRLLTAWEFLEVFSWWATSVWANRPLESYAHRMALAGDAPTPNQLHDRLAELHGTASIPLHHDDLTGLLPNVLRNVTAKGIQKDHRIYKLLCDAGPYQDRRSHRPGAPGDDRNWIIHYDPDDIRVVWLFDHHKHEYHPAVWDRAEMFHMPLGDATWREMNANPWPSGQPTPTLDDETLAHVRAPARHDPVRREQAGPRRAPADRFRQEMRRDGAIPPAEEAIDQDRQRRRRRTEHGQPLQPYTRDDAT